MKLSATRRALLLANIFNSLVALYFIIIAIVGLVQLRWYHQLTITVKVRHVITLTTSYFAFFILICVGLILLGLFITSSLRLAQPRDNSKPATTTTASETTTTTILTEPSNEHEPTSQQAGIDHKPHQQVANELQAIHLQDEHSNIRNRPPTSIRPAGGNRRAVVLRDTSISEETNGSICCSIVLHLIVTIGLIIILLIWLFNTGELVREAISTQLDYAFARYQFTNRSNHYSIAIDGMQDINNCCGSLDFTDFPHQRVSGLSSGHYPGSCCGKNIFGVNARVLCTADEIYRAKQTSGCTTVLANYYDLISLLVVPIALVCLFVNITIIALITISKRGNIGLGHHQRHHHHHHHHLHHNQRHHHHAFAHLGDNNNNNNENLPAGGAGPGSGAGTAGGNSKSQISSNRSNLKQQARQLQQRPGDTFGSEPADAGHGSPSVGGGGGADGRRTESIRM